MADLSTVPSRRILYLMSAVMLMIFILQGYYKATHQPVTDGFDEVAHASYVAALQAHPAIAVDLDRLRMLDPLSFTFTAAPNYLNHPAPYYLLLASLLPSLEGDAGALSMHRLFNLALVTVALALLLMAMLRSGLPKIEFYGYAIPLVTIPVLPTLAGSINNDTLAFFGGALLFAAVWKRFDDNRNCWLLLAFAGMIIASYAKLTGMLLSAGMLGAVLGYLVWRSALPRYWLLLFALAVFIASIPYLFFFHQYGSFAPNTPAQMAMLQSGAAQMGWDRQARVSLFPYAFFFIRDFLYNWMPVLTPRSAWGQWAMCIPLMTLLAALFGGIFGIRRLLRRRETPRDVIVIAGGVSLMATFIIHLIFSYHRYLMTGWMLDSYPRYYLPIAVIVPLACLSLYDTLPTRYRPCYAAFITVSPLIYSFLAVQ